MVVELFPNRYRRFSILLGLIALVSFTNVIGSNFRTEGNTRHVNHDSGVNFNVTQAKRRFVLRKLIRTDEKIENSDERGINIGESSVTKLKELTSSATQNFEKLAATAKLELMSNKELVTKKLYTQFEVDTVESNLLESAQFLSWYGSVNRAFKNNPQHGEMDMVTTLAKQHGDEGVAKLLYEARGGSSSAIAEKLTDAQFNKWSIERMDTGDVFKILKLDQAGDDLFQSPLLSYWERFSVKFEKNPESAIFSTLQKEFGDERLASMIIAAKQHSSIATKLEGVELEHWFSSGKTSDDVFKLLNLNDDTGNILKNPAFSTWVAFDAKINKDDYHNVAKKFLFSYENKQLAEVIGADYSGTTATVAKKLESVVMSVWKSERRSPDSVFKLFSLDEEKGVRSLLKNPALQRWISYVKLVGKDPDELLMLELKTRFSEAEITSMLAVARKDFDTKDTAKRLEKLQEKPSLERLDMNDWVA